VRTRLDAVSAENASLRDNLDIVLFELNRLDRAMLDAIQASAALSGLDINIVSVFCLINH
jgi:hypothetical protein